MKRELALTILAEIMDWDDVRADAEIRWLDLMSKFKYDGYRDLHAGIRFIESLVNWLLQFEASDRQIAYDFIRSNLVYVGPMEMDRLVKSFYPEFVQPYLVKKVAELLSVPPYLVWADDKALEELKKQLRKTLFVGLSDGARMDEFRRINVGNISNEQVIITPQVDDEKWRDLLNELRGEKESFSKDERFSSVFLVDDFTASGTSLIRNSPDEETGESKWKGKIKKFFSTLAHVEKVLLESVFDDNWEIRVHHHLATHQAAMGDNCVAVRFHEAIESGQIEGGHERIKFTFGHILPFDLPLTADPDNKFLKLAKLDKYFDPILNENPHIKESGTDDIHLGYAECALPLVLEHNTPNNSIPLLWAETFDETESGAHKMRPLFRRRQRHS